MRYRRLLGNFFSMLILCSCVPSAGEVSTASDNSLQPVTEYIQDEKHLGLRCEEKYVPLNYSSQRGIWYPYLYYGDYMTGKSEEEFRRLVRERFADAKNKDINTVYVHVRPCGDAYYKSEIFPKGSCLDGDYDPLAIMLEEGHSLGLSVHAWINPLRCQTKEEMKKLGEDFILKNWAENHCGTYINTVGDRYYLNPAYDEVVSLICDGISEIIRNYNVDGIHIDDYFYPTTSPDFDREAFEKSGSKNLSQWRLSVVSRLVHAMYESVKRSGGQVLFGISPQGNIDANYSSQYADVRLWGSTVGYCDYIVPQIYFGYKNSTCPFSETLKQWEKLASCENVSLIIGLSPYKLGKKDRWAGESGELEWIETPDIIDRQIDDTGKSSAKGYALYY